MSGAKRAAACAAVAIMALASTVVGGQAPAPAAPAPTPGRGPAAAGEVVLAPGNWSPIVADLEKSIAFYKLLGLEVAPAETPGPRPYNNEPKLLSMFGMPNAQLRYVVARVPGAAVHVEPVEVKGLDRKPVIPRPQDPGGTTVVFNVRDIDKTFASLKAAGIPIVTPGGKPLAFSPNNKAEGFIVADPDGHYIEVVEPDPIPQSPLPAETNVIGGTRVRFTVANTERMLPIYRDILKLEPRVEDFRNRPLMDLMNLPGADVKLTSIRLPGSTHGFEFIEMRGKGVDGRPIHPRLQDPGATRFQLRVRDLSMTLTELKAAGLTVVSTGGGAVTLRSGTPAAIVKDPNDVYLVLLQAAPAN